MTSTLLKAFRFFSKHGGSIVGEHAKGALQLARAEQYAKANDYAFTWEYDDTADLGDHAYWCKDERREQADRDCHGEHYRYTDRNRHSHEVLGCTLYDVCSTHRDDYYHDAQDLRRCSDCTVLESLWGIIDPSDEYKRVVEAELAWQAMPEHPALSRDVKAIVNSGF